MKRADVVEYIREAANKHGFEFENNEHSMNIRDGWDWSESWVNFTIHENAKWIMAENRVEIALDFSASISKMGGSPDVDDLLKASDTIKRAAELIDELKKMNLSYDFEIEVK